jgi:hypothetical protein
MEKPENLITVRLLMQGKEVGSIIGKVSSLLAIRKQSILLNLSISLSYLQKGDNIKSIREQVNNLLHSIPQLF